MSQKWKRPGDAVQRILKADKERQMASTSLPQTYLTSRDLQTRYLRRRCGLTKPQAQVLATLIWGTCS